MPVKIVSENKLTGAGDITTEQIGLLHTHYKDDTGKRKKKGDPYKDFDGTQHTRYAWFSLSEILAFLKGNGADPTKPGFDPRPFGLRLYFAQHDLTVYRPTPRDPTIPVTDYDNMDTIIFVLTLNDADQLREGQSVSIAPFGDQDNLQGGSGLDNARLCPPECSVTGSAGSVIN